MSVPAVVKVNEVFNFFDTNADGIWDAAETQRARRELEGDSITASEFSEMCKELGADPNEGLRKPHLKKLYADELDQLDAAYQHIQQQKDAPKHTPSTPDQPPPPPASFSFQASEGPVAFTFGGPPAPPAAAPPAAEPGQGGTASPDTGGAPAFSFGAPSAGAPPAVSAPPSSAASSQASVVSGVMVERIFSHFDKDDDGFWCFDEVKASQLFLHGEPLSRSDYEEMCDEMFADAGEGWAEEQLRAFYDGDADSLRRDYRKVVRAKKGGTAAVEPTQPVPVREVERAAPAPTPTPTPAPAPAPPAAQPVEAPRPAAAPAQAVAQRASPVSTASDVSTKSSAMLHRIHEHFDSDGDGHWSYAEVNAARRGLGHAELSRQDYRDMCGDMFAEPDEGWGVEHLQAVYAGDPRSLRRDYKVVVQAAASTRAQVAKQAHPVPSQHSSAASLLAPSSSSSSHVPAPADPPPAPASFRVEVPRVVAAVQPPPPPPEPAGSPPRETASVMSHSTVSSGGATRSHVMVERIFAHFDSDGDGVWSFAEASAAQQALVGRLLSRDAYRQVAQGGGWGEERLSRSYRGDTQRLKQDYRTVLRLQSVHRVSNSQPAQQHGKPDVSPAPSWSPVISALTPTPPRHTEPSPLGVHTPQSLPANAPHLQLVVGHRDAEPHRRSFDVPPNDTTQRAQHATRRGTASFSSSDLFPRKASSSLSVSETSEHGLMLRRVLDEFDADGDGKWDYEEVDRAKRTLEGAGLPYDEYELMCGDMSVDPQHGWSMQHLSTQYDVHALRRDYKKVLRLERLRKRSHPDAPPAQRSFSSRANPPLPPAALPYAEQQKAGNRAAAEYIRLPFDVAAVKAAYVRQLEADYSHFDLEGLQTLLKSVNGEFRVMQQITVRNSDVRDSLLQALRYRIREDKEKLHLRRDHCRRLGAYRRATPADLAFRDAYVGRPLTEEGTFADLSKVLQYIQARVAAELNAFSPEELMEAVGEHDRQAEGLVGILHVMEDWQEMVASTLRCNAFLKVERLELADQSNMRVYNRHLSDLARAELFLEDAL